MLERFLNKKVRVKVLMNVYTIGKSLKGVLEEVDDEFILLSGNMLISRKYLCSIKEC